VTRLVDLRYYPRPWQQTVHRSLKRFNVLALHRRAGKTMLAVAELIDKTLKLELPHGRYGYIAPFRNQAKNIAWTKFKQRLAPLSALDAVVLNESELTITFKHNGARIALFGADNADAMRGDYFDGVVMDEVAQMDPEVWDDIVRPMLADRLGWALFIGTPNGVNLFSEMFYGAAKDPDNWFAARYTVYETNALDPDEVAHLRANMNSKAFEREMMCSFEVAGDNQLISLGDVMAAQARQMIREDYVFAPKVIGVDPARFGNDRSVIAKRQGLKVEPSQSFQGIDNVKLGNLVIQEKMKWGADAIFCDAGQGAGVIDYIRHLGHEVVEVWFGGKPNSPEYKDKRTEMWVEMAMAIPMSSLPPGHPMRQDLAAPTYSFDTAGRKVLESKDSLKARGIPSPDEGDALALTYAQPVAVKTERQRFFEAVDPTRKAGMKEYDPYDLA